MVNATGVQCWRRGRAVGCRAVTGPRPERRARNEASFRKVNEAIAAGRARGDAAQPVAFVCECATVGCTVVLELTPGEYETVRSNPRRFLVATGHQAPDLE